MSNGTVRAVPIEPRSDDQIIEVLPGVAADRARQRRERQLLAARPDDPRLALGMARRLLDQAHELGDPRFAGQAMAALEPWQDERTMPVDLLLMKATLQQYLHEFDVSAKLLELTTARAPSEPQAWITLATVRRVQGRYDASDAACRRLEPLGAALHGRACLAENAALRGRFDEARRELEALVASAPDASQRGWLLTTLAELEERAGRPAAAEPAWKAVLALGPDAYATLGYADFLIDQQRDAEALRLLKSEVRSDAVVLRLAIAGVRAKAASAEADVADMRERIALANLRPGAEVYHGREQAMFELAVEGRARRALDLATLNAAHQREPLDLLVLAAAARAARDPAAIDAAKQLAQGMGLKDRRLDALLQ